MCFPSVRKSKLPSHQVFGVLALEVNEIVQVTPPKLRREMGMCGTAAIMICAAQRCYTSTRTRTRVSCSLVPGAAYVIPGTRYIQAQPGLQNQKFGVFSRGKTLCERDYLIRGVTSRATPSCDGVEAEAQFPDGT